MDNSGIQIKTKISSYLIVLGFNHRALSKVFLFYLHIQIGYMEEGKRSNELDFYRQ